MKWLSQHNFKRSFYGALVFYNASILLLIWLIDNLAQIVSGEHQMYFKNLIAYHTTQPLSLNDDDLQKMLEENKFRPCGSNDIATMGFCSPFERAGQSDTMFHKVSGRYLFTLKKQERILPASVINEELAQKVAHIEIETGSPVGKKAKADLKQEIITKLLPQAFVKNSYTNAYLSPEEGMVVVDSSSHGKAEAFLAMLRKSLGSLPVVPLARRSLQSELTHWLTDGTPERITLLEEAEFKSTDDSASVLRCKNQPLDSEEVTMHLDSGKLVQKVSFEYSEAFSATICEDGTFKKLTYSDRLKEECDDIPKDQVAARLDAEFALMSGEVSAFLLFITETFQLIEK